MSRWIIIVPLALIAGAVLFFSSVFVIDETEQAFITQFGRPVARGPITEPGLNWRGPFIQKIRKFDKRFLEWDGDPNQVTTRDKTYISIDTYARWRINDPLVFFQKVTDELGAQTRLDDILDGATRNAVARHDLVEIVRSLQREEVLPEVPEEAGGADVGEENALREFQVGRDAITKDILKNASPQLEKWGIELLDIRFKRINYDAKTKLKIFERMISERQRIADKYRSEGQGEAAKIQGQRERELKTITSEADRKVREIEGQADAEAAAIYAAAYDQSPEAREFYQFIRTMETYGTSLSANDWLLLSTRGDFFRYLRKAGPPEKGE